MKQSLFVLLLCALATGLFLGGCAPQTQQMPHGARIADMPLDQQMEQADAAWMSGDFERAELFYERVLANPAATETMQARARERYARAALAAGHPRRALDAFEAWAAANPQVRDTARWQQDYATALRRLERDDALLAHLTEGAQNNSLPLESRLEFATEATTLSAQLDAPARALPMLVDLYPRLPDAKAKLALESAMREAYADLPPEELEGLAASAEGVPARMLATLGALQRAEDDATWPSAWSQLSATAADVPFADTTFVYEALAQLEADKGRPVNAVAMAVPLSGRFASVGWAILRGTAAAQWSMVREGKVLEIRVVNTAAEGWVDELAALPPEYTLVGGPLRVESLQAMQAHTSADTTSSDAPSGENTRASDSTPQTGLLDKRVVMAFLPSLGEDLLEGRDAWRFFGSPQDEARALTSFATSAGVSQFAILYPRERYGLRMAQLFNEAVKEQGGSLTGMGAYPPGDIPAWGRAVADLLNVRPKGPDGERRPSPTPDFQAVFLPDGWRQAQLIAPQFHFYEEDRLILLGPQLWSQALVHGADKAGGDLRYFDLAVCTGAWWPEGQAPGLAALRADLAEMGLGEPDFWTALGYDFIRFARSMDGVRPGASHEDVNRLLAAAPSLDFALAPLQWDVDGLASQQMFLFQPSEASGLTLVEPQTIAARRDRFIQRRERLLQRRENKRKAEEAAQAAEPTTPAAPSLIIEEPLQ